MSSEEIKADCEKQYAIIEIARLRLVELRTICDHKNTYEGTYSWRPGCYDPAIICSDCGHLIKNLNQPIISES